MNYPLISEYVEAIKAAEDNFEELANLRPVLGDDGQPVMTSGNFAVVFKMEDTETGKFYALKCFTKEQEGRAEAYHQIADALKDVDSPYLVSLRYLDKELFVDTDQTSETEFPVLLMDWVEGKTLDKYLRENLDDKYALELLAYRFSQLAQWLIPQPFAHGDLKPDNILVREDGTLVLVDYDGMYVPAMKGQKARELGSPDFRHPQRTENDFDEHIDDFPVVSTLLSLKTISLNPLLLEEFGNTDRMLFSVRDYNDISNCQLLKRIFPSADMDLNLLMSAFVILLSRIPIGFLPSRLYQCHVNQNTVEHYFKLGGKYKKGIDIEQNGFLSVYYYNIAAEFGFAKAQYKLGVCYRDGFGVNRDMAKSILWFKKAAIQGELEALYNIGFIYVDLKDPRSDEVFIEVVHEAMNKINSTDSTQAYMLLGDCLIKGKGIAKDEKKGCKYLTIAAKRGDDNAQALLGYCYKKGIGVAIDKNEAFKWFEKSAKQGNAMGQAALGSCYCNSEGVPLNISLGINWLTKSAKQGVSASQFALGDYYEEDDEELAFYWYEQSALRGNTKAEYVMGTYHECGIKVAANKDKAMVWYKKAADKGYLPAQRALKRLVVED